MTLNLGKQQKDPFWGQSAASLIACYIMLLKRAFPPEYRHLANALQLLKLSSSSAKLVDRLVVSVRDEKVLTEYKGFLGIASENTRGGILATAKAVLQPFADEKLALLTSWDSVPFGSLRGRHALFVTTPSLQAEYYRFCVSVLFDQLFNHLLERLPGKGDGYCFALIDELTSLQIESLGRFLEVSRKYRCGTLCAVQSLTQLSTMYKDEAQTILDNCNTQIYLNSADATAERLEKVLGQTEYEDEKGRVKVRPLMSRQQIKALGADRGIALFPNSNPMLCRLTPYYKSGFKGRTSLPPHASPSRPPHSEAPMVTESFLESYLDRGRP